MYKCYIQLRAICSSPSIWWARATGCATDSLVIQLLQNTVFNSYLNFDWKWNCKGDIIQIFSSEIILVWENGSQGHHFGKFLISKFLKGLMHSALWQYQGFFRRTSPYWMFFYGPIIDFNSNNGMVWIDHSGLTWTLCLFFLPLKFSVI